MRILGAIVILASVLAFPGTAAADHCGATGEIRPAVGPPGTVFAFSAYLGTSADLFVYRDGALVRTLRLDGDDELRALITTGPNDDGTWRAEAITVGSTECRAEVSFQVMPGSTADVWVGLTGPRDWEPRFDYSLEIRGREWTTSQDSPGGLVVEPIPGPTIVRLRRLPDCTPVVRFVARPGGLYAIRFDEHEVPDLEDWTLLGMDTPGPPSERGSLICPRLPDTATAPSPSSSIALIAGVGLITLAVLRLARRHARTVSGVPA